MPNFTNEELQEFSYAFEYDADLTKIQEFLDAGGDVTAPSKWGYPHKKPETALKLAARATKRDIAAKFAAEEIQKAKGRTLSQPEQGRIQQFQHFLDNTANGEDAEPFLTPNSELYQAAVSRREGMFKLMLSKVPAHELTPEVMAPVFEWLLRRGNHSYKMATDLVRELPASTLFTPPDPDSFDVIPAEPPVSIALTCMQEALKRNDVSVVNLLRKKATDGKIEPEIYAAVMVPVFRTLLYNDEKHQQKMAMDLLRELPSTILFQRVKDSGGLPGPGLNICDMCIQHAVKEGDFLLSNSW